MFKKYYLQYQTKIYWYIYRKITDPEAAEDITADVFMKLYENWNNVGSRKPNALAAWLYTVARNASIDHLRKKGRRQIRNIEDEETDSATRVFENFAEEAMKEEDLKNMREALKELSEEEKEIINLRFEEELKFNEIAEIIGKEEGACKMTLYRSIRKVRQVLNELYQADG